MDFPKLLLIAQLALLPTAGATLIRFDLKSGSIPGEKYAQSENKEQLASLLTELPQHSQNPEDLLVVYIPLVEIDLARTDREVEVYIPQSTNNATAVLGKILAVDSSRIRDDYFPYAALVEVDDLQVVDRIFPDSSMWIEARFNTHEDINLIDFLDYKYLSPLRSFITFIF